MSRALRPDRGVLASASCALALLVCMFTFAWYGVDRIPGTPSARHGTVRTENAWQGLSVVRWVMLLTILVAMGLPLLRLRWPAIASRAASSTALLALGALTSVLLLFRVLIDPPTPPAVPDQKLGALLGLLFALGITLGAWDSVRARATSGDPRARQERAPRSRISLS